MTRRLLRLAAGLALLEPLVFTCAFASSRHVQVCMSAVDWSSPEFTRDVLLTHAMAMLTGVLVAGMLVACATHLLLSKTIPEEQKLPWILLLVTTSIVSMPVYWYLYVWRKPTRITPEMLSPRRH